MPETQSSLGHKLKGHAQWLKTETGHAQMDVFVYNRDGSFWTVWKLVCA